jgi:hypothetical protein
MAYHIKRDGQFLCKTRIISKGIFKNKFNYIPFKQAHTSQLKSCCEACKKRYFEILSDLKEPIVVNDKNKRMPHHFEDILISQQVVMDQKDYLPAKSK